MEHDTRARESGDVAIGIGRALMTRREKQKSGYPSTAATKTEVTIVSTESSVAKSLLVRLNSIVEVHHVVHSNQHQKPVLHEVHMKVNKITLMAKRNGGQSLAQVDYNFEGCQSKVPLHPSEAYATSRGSHFNGSPL